MEEIKLNFLDSLFSTFKKAPEGFCNSDNGKILTHKGIKLRQFFQTGGLPNISNKEMVFRKFNQLRNISYEKQIVEIQSVMAFLLKQGLNKEDVARILVELISEINNYNKFPGRIIFNPFS